MDLNQLPIPTDHPPPSAEALVRAQEAIDRLTELQVPIEELDTDVLGGIAIHFQRPGYRAWLAIMNSGHDTLMLSRPGRIEHLPWGETAIQAIREPHRFADHHDGNATAWQLVRDAIDHIPAPEDLGTRWALERIRSALARRRVAHRCVDCQDASPEPYMVQDDLWAIYGTQHRVLCLPCLQARIPRPLTRDDFKQVPCNRLLFWGLDHAL